jgi:hypothetical protein
MGVEKAEGREQKAGADLLSEQDMSCPSAKSARTLPC